MSSPLGCSHCAAHVHLRILLRKSHFLIYLNIYFLRGVFFCFRNFMSFLTFRNFVSALTLRSQFSLCVHSTMKRAVRVNLKLSCVLLFFFTFTPHATSDFILLFYYLPSSTMRFQDDHIISD